MAGTSCSYTTIALSQSHSSSCRLGNRYIIFCFFLTLMCLSVANFVDGEVLLMLSNEDIAAMISEVGLRYKFLNALKKLVRKVLFL